MIRISIDTSLLSDSYPKLELLNKANSHLILKVCVWSWVVVANALYCTVCYGMQHGILYL